MWQRFGTPRPGMLHALAAPLPLEVLRVQGATHAASSTLTALYLGNRASLPFLAGCFFRAPRIEPVATLAHPLQLPRRARELGEQADLVLTEQPPLWARLSPAPADVTLPAWVRQQLSLAERGDALFPRALEKEVRRLQRRHEYRLEIGRAEDWAQRFYREFYVPHVRARFGEAAVVLDETRFVHLARGQRIARLCTPTQWVAGMLYRRRGDDMRLGWYGAAPGRQWPGASEVLDALCIRHEHAAGVRRVHLGNSRPCLSDGVLRYKRRFGAQVAATRFPQSRLGIRILRWTPALRECLQLHPMITVRDGSAFVVRWGERAGRPTFDSLPAAGPA